MTGKTTTLCIRIDAELKRQAEELFGALGMSLSTAITIFIRQAIREGRMPFDVRLERPSREPVTALHEK